jgi:ketosteroid isomerase-like protein
MFLSWLARQVLARVMARTRKGDIRPTSMMDAPDVRFTFPGENSWAGTLTGKDAHRRWLERFAKIGLQIYPDEVVAVGFPWNTTIVVRCTDHLDSPEGERVYENRAVIWAKTKWGRIKEIEVYEDTEKTKALDLWLERNEHRLNRIAAAA